MDARDARGARGAGGAGISRDVVARGDQGVDVAALGAARDEIVADDEQGPGAEGAPVNHRERQIHAAA
jgi:hypothetical protein